MSDLTGTKGGSGVWQRIISEMPAHEVYIEPFWGRGTIARKKRPALVTIGIDLDPDAMESGRVLGALMFLANGPQWVKDYFRLWGPNAGFRRRVRNWQANMGDMGPAERQAVWEACDGVFRGAS